MPWYAFTPARCLKKDDTAMTPEDTPPGWSELEAELINHREVFLHKPAIMKKAETRLTLFRDAMAVELLAHPAPCPAATDTTEGQIARGENNKGFPFLSLDIPQMFSKSEMYTLRTLFWWGHYLGFFLILKGANLIAWTDQLIMLKDQPEFSDILVSMWPTPWEWGREHFISVAETSGDELAALAESQQYMKIGRIYPLNSRSFGDLDWSAAGLSTWRTVSRVTRL